MANTQTEVRPDHEILIVGAGFSGIGLGIKLKKNYLHDFIILERADDLGGTWRDNTYPGLTVDIPSASYSYPFEPNPDWTRVYARGPELKAYADHCADKYDVRRHIRFKQSVTRATYDEANNLWRITLADGATLTARYFVTATGALTAPKMPDIEGVESFKGKVIHTARWDHQHDLTNERVAVIGTGATAIQLIPEIVDKVQRIDVYQRTPIWLLPKMDAVIPEWLKRAYRFVPGLQKGMRLLCNFLTELWVGVGGAHFKQFPWIFRWLEEQSIKHIRNQVNDPVLQAKLIPTYNHFCKRPSVSNVYYPVFNRASVELITDPIARITPTGIETKDGKVREIDTLICATGFQVFEPGTVPSCEIIGRGGQEIGDYWTKNRYKAYQGITVPGYPNYFMIFGPYAIASGSYFGMIDIQVRHFLRCLKEARQRAANYVEIKQRAHDEDFARVIRQRDNTVLYSGNCASAHTYYYDRNGDGPLLRPVTHFSMWLRSFTFNLNDYDFAAK